MSGRAGRRLAVLDPLALAGVLQRVVGAAGSQKDAAARMGIDPRHLRRLLKQDGTHDISEPLYERLVAIAAGSTSLRLPDADEYRASDRDRAALDRAVLGPSGAFLLQAHNRWLALALEPFGLGREAGLALRPADTVRELSDAEFRAEFGAELDQERAFWSLVNPFYDAENLASRRLFLDFEKQIVRRGFGSEPGRREIREVDRDFRPEFVKFFLAPRGLLALCRVVAPLLVPEARDGSALELGIADLKRSGRLLEFLECSIQRELVLLERDNDLKHAQLIARECDAVGRAASTRKQAKRKRPLDAANAGG